MNAMSSLWITLCKESDLVRGSGVCALLQKEERAEQVALFHSSDGNEVFAIGNHDPIGDANVLSRGIMGSLGERLVVASPLYKQHFDLRTGQCVEDPNVQVPAWQARIAEGNVQIRIG